LINNEPTLGVQFGSEGDGTEGMIHVHILWGVPYPGKDFAINVGEKFSLALTSENWESLADPAPDVTNGSIIAVTMDHVPGGLRVQALDPVPCWFNSTMPFNCPGGTLAVATSGPTVFHGPGTFTFQYVVKTVDNSPLPENTNLPFNIRSTGFIWPFWCYMTATVSILPRGNSYIPRFVNFAENPKPLNVVWFTLW
jgi:hypothetical protein